MDITMFYNIPHTPFLYPRSEWFYKSIETFQGYAKKSGASFQKMSTKFPACNTCNTQVAALGMIVNGSRRPFSSTTRTIDNSSKSGNETMATSDPENSSSTPNSTYYTLQEEEYFIIGVALAYILLIVIVLILRYFHRDDLATRDDSFDWRISVTRHPEADRGRHSSLALKKNYTEEQINQCLVTKKVLKHGFSHDLEFNQEVKSYSQGGSQCFEVERQISSRMEPLDSRLDWQNVPFVCNICLEAFEVGDSVSFARYHRSCNHAFHTLCLYAWLKKHNSCPICRAVLLSSDEISDRCTVIKYLRSLRTAVNPKVPDRDEALIQSRVNGRFCVEHGFVSRLDKVGQNKYPLNREDIESREETVETDRRSQDRDVERCHTLAYQ